LKNLIHDTQGIIRWPKKPSHKKIAIEWLSTKFKFENQYSEKEVNQIIAEYHSFNDIALLRRELVSKKFLTRKNDGSIYWKIKD